MTVTITSDNPYVAATSSTEPATSATGQSQTIHLAPVPRVTISGDGARLLSAS